MTIPFKQSAHPHPSRRRRSTQSAPKAAPRPAPPSTVVPQLVPLLDLLADLIARELWRQRSEANARLEHEASEAHAMAAAQGALTVVVETPGNSAPFPSFPAKSRPECHPNPTSHPSADEPV